MKVLVLAPHTDDGEIGCGGSMARHIESGDAVYYVAFTALESDQLRDEVARATEALGMPRTNLIVWDYPVRRFSEKRQDILDDILSIKTAVEPDIVYMPCLHDVHQDHQTVAHEALRGLRNTTMLGYEMPRNNLTFNAQAFVTLSEKHVELKVESIQCYESQKNRTYTTPEFVRAQCHMRGVQIDQPYAEAFEVIRWVR